MKNKNDLGILAGIAVTLIGFIGVVWKAIEATIYRFRNPDFTDMRVLIENPQLTIWAIIFAIMAFVGAEIAKYYANNRRR